jgi:hypothetical protein
MPTFAPNRPHRCLAGARQRTQVIPLAAVEKELLERAGRYASSLKSLWNEEAGIFLNGVWTAAG